MVCFFSKLYSNWCLLSIFYLYFKHLFFSRTWWPLASWSLPSERSWSWKLESWALRMEYQTSSPLVLYKISKVYFVENIYHFYRALFALLKCFVSRLFFNRFNISIVFYLLIVQVFHYFAYARWNFWIVQILFIAWITEFVNCVNYVSNTAVWIHCE